MSANVEKMFAVRKPTWHGLEKLLDHDPTTEEAYTVSGLDWTVRKERLLFHHETGIHESDMYGVVRCTDGAFLGACKDRYQLFQNRSAFDWAEPLVDSGLYKWESGGALNGGRTCWVLLNSGEREIIPGDSLKNYLLMTWSHDGSSSVMVRPTSIRVVCNNTLTAARRERGVRHHVRHTVSMKLRLDDVRRYYDESQECFQQQQTDLKRLLNTELTADKLEHYTTELDRLLFEGDTNSSRSANHRDNIRSDIQTMIAGAASGHKDLGIENTLYGAFQATSEYLEHYATQKGSADGYNILFGNRGKQIDAAFELAMEMADGSTKFTPSYLKSGYRQELEGKAEFNRLMNM